MRTVIGVLGSDKEARLKLMKELSKRLENEGYSIILVFHDRSSNDTNTSSTLIVSTLGPSTFIRANFKLAIDEIERLLLNKWCLMLIEEYRAAPYVVAATSECDINELGPRSLAIVPLNYDLMRITTSLRDKIVTIDKVAEIIREALIEDVMKLLMREDCGECGFNNCKELAETIVKGENTPIKCVKRRESVRLMVDENLIPLNPFTSKMFIQVLTSLLSILKGVPRSFKKASIELNLD